MEQATLFSELILENNENNADGDNNNDAETTATMEIMAMETEIIMQIMAMGIMKTV